MMYVVNPLMIIFLYGPDTYRSRERLHQLKEAYHTKFDPSNMNTLVLDGEKLSFEEFRRAVGASGFLAPKRMIVVEQIIGKNKRKDIQQEIVDYLGSKDWKDNNILIFWEADVLSESRKRLRKPAKKKTAEKKSPKPLLKMLGEGEHAESFALLTGGELKKFIRDRARELHGSLQEAAVDELINRAGSDTWQITHEVAKLVAYSYPKPATTDDVRKLVLTSFDDNIFHLTDALADRNLRETLRLFGELLANGLNELYILTMLIRQCRLLVQTHNIIEQEPHPATVAARLRLPPFIAQQLMRQAKKFTSDELREVFQQLVILDRKLKTSQGNPGLLFDLFAASVCV